MIKTMIIPCSIKHSTLNIFNNYVNTAKLIWDDILNIGNKLIDDDSIDDELKSYLNETICGKLLNKYENYPHLISSLLHHYLKNIIPYNNINCNQIFSDSLFNHNLYTSFKIFHWNIKEIDILSPDSLLSDTIHLKLEDDDIIILVDKDKITDEFNILFIELRSESLLYIEYTE